MSAAIKVSVRGEAERAAQAHVEALSSERFASRLFAKDPTLWGADAEEEAAKRLGWVDLGTASGELIAPIIALRDELHAQGVDRVVLCGMGGSSLAPEVICAHAGVDLVVLDSSDPDQVRHAITQLARTVVVVSSKSGSTVETDSAKRAFEAAFAAADIDAQSRIVVVTDPGSPLEEKAQSDGYRVFTADPNVGGRYSALTAFGLVPSGLAGADIAALLEQAAAVQPELAADSASNPALILGAAMAGTEPLRDKLFFVPADSLPGFADWAEQLIAESTGKSGRGILPVVLAAASEAQDLAQASDITVASLDSKPFDGPSSVAVSGSLGAQLILWEAATAVAGRLLGIDPFNQPDVESAKNAARSLLDSPPESDEPDAVIEGIEVRFSGSWWAAQTPTTLPEVIEAIYAEVGPKGYLALMVYLNREEHGGFEEVRGAVAAQVKRPVTFGWGPRFLHSTGQLHKGGPAVGVFVQITGEPSEDLTIPGRDFGFSTLIAAQAAGDADVLAEQDRPVLRLHLRDIPAGLDTLRRAIG